MIIDELDDIKCEECYRLAIEDMAEFATDPENLARLDPEAASEMRRYLGKLLGRPNDSLEELARALAVEAKSASGSSKTEGLNSEVGRTSRLPCCTAIPSSISLEKLG